MKKKLLIAAAILVVLLAAVVIVVGMSLGKIIKAGVETVGPKITKTEMKLDSANLNILGGAGTLKGFTLGNPEGYKTAAAIKAGSVSVGVKPGSLFSDKIVVRHVRVEGPEITFEGTIGTANNLSKILDNVNETTGGSTEKPKEDSKKEPTGGAKDKPKAEAKSEAPSKKLQVDEFLITGATVHLSMTMLGGKAVSVPLPPITLKDLGAGPEGITAGELTQKVLKEVTVETLKAAEKAVADLGKDAAGLVTKGATGTVDKATKGVGNLFKKK